MNMQPVMFTANTNAAVNLPMVGRERTPLIVIDDFALDTAAIIDYGRNSAQFDVDKTSAYPGIRASLDREHLILAIQSVLLLLHKVYAIPPQLKLRPVSSFYSLVATAPEDLRTLQRLPHFDSNRPYYFAITHFLHDGTHGGTGLFRHRPTGFENITADRLDEYIQAGDHFLRSHGEPPPGYCTQSSDHYELYERIDYKPNRLVVYPGTLLHSGLIDVATDIDPDPNTGRLTANIFIEFQ
jgi:hypothetical protein